MMNKDAVLKEILPLITLGVWEWDAVTKKLTGSEEFYHIHGLVAYAEEAVAKESITPLYDLCLEVFSTGEEKDRVYTLFLPDDSTRQVRSVAKPVYKQENIVKVIGVAQHMTEDKKPLQAARKPSACSVRSSSGEDLRKFIAEVTHDVVREWKIQPDELWWHEGQYSLFGFAPSAPQPTLETWYSRIHPEDSAKSKNSLLEAIALKKRVWTAEYRFRKHDGAYAWISDKGIIYYDEAGQPECMLCVMKDISQHKEDRLALEDKNQQLTKVVEVLDNFVYTVAHDLKSPVANLTFLVQLLQKAPAEKKDEILGMIGTSVARLDQTIHALVEVVQVQSDQTTEKNISFEKVLAPILADFAQDIAHIQVTVETDLKHAPEICYTEAYLESIMKNLLGNALKYRDERRPLKIKISTHREALFVVLTISDNGIGMDVSQHQKKLFKPFNRFTQQATGKGIGLFLVKSMVEKNGGHIKVESQPNQGTTFTVFLKDGRTHEN